MECKADPLREEEQLILPEGLIDDLRSLLELGMEPEELIGRLVPVVNCIYGEVRMNRLGGRYGRKTPVKRPNKVRRLKRKLVDDQLTQNRNKAR